MKKSTKLALMALAGLAVAAEPSFALTPANDAEIALATGAGAVSAGVVATGVIAMGGVMTGLGLVYNWLKR